MSILFLKQSDIFLGTRAGNQLETSLFSRQPRRPSVSHTKKCMENCTQTCEILGLNWTAGLWRSRLDWNPRVRERSVHVGEGSEDSELGFPQLFQARKLRLVLPGLLLCQAFGSWCYCVIVHLGLCGSDGAALSWSLSAEKVLHTVWVWAQADQSRLRRTDLSGNLISDRKGFVNWKLHRQNPQGDL